MLQIHVELGRLPPSQPSRRVSCTNPCTAQVLAFVPPAARISSPVAETTAAIRERQQPATDDGNGMTCPLGPSNDNTTA